MGDKPGNDIEDVLPKLPFREAIEAAVNRLRMPKGLFLQLDAANRSRAFTVAWVTKLSLLKSIHAVYVDALTNGTSLRDFRNALPEMMEREGWVGENWWHAEVVYNQNRMMAYGAGVYQQAQESGSTAWRYHKNTERHADLDGKVFGWDDLTFFPPIDFNCQCWVEELFSGEEPEQLDSSESVIDRGVRPPGVEEKDFVYDPRAYYEGPPLDTEGLPDRLRTRIEQLAVKQGIGRERRRVEGI